MKKCIIGFSLIEVLISLFILSMILLGFDAMEIVAMRANHDAYFLSMAENQLQNMMERLRALDKNHDVDQEVAIWNQQNQDVLPKGQGYVFGKFPLYKISIFWGKEKHPVSCDEMMLGELSCLTAVCQL